MSGRPLRHGSADRSSAVVLVTQRDRNLDGGPLIDGATSMSDRQKNLDLKGESGRDRVVDPRPSTRGRHGCNETGCRDGVSKGGGSQSLNVDGGPQRRRSDPSRRTRRVVPMKE